MNAPLQFEVTQALKLALRARGVTYKLLAERIGVSEQTVKRLFMEKDCLLSRLNQICEAINLDLRDLLAYADQVADPIVELSAEQEAYLRDNPGHFVFLFLLTNDYPVAHIQSVYGLSDLGVYRYLRKLEQMGFIDLEPGNRYRLKIEGRLLMRLRGPLHQLVRRVNQIFFDEVLERDDHPEVSFDSSYRFMTRKSLHELMNELNQLHRKFRDQAKYNQVLFPREELVPVKWTTLVAEFDVCGRWPLPEPEA